MKTHVPILVSAASALLACSTSHIEPVPVSVTPIEVPAALSQMNIELDAPYSDERREILMGRFCHLGSSCLTMDPRPFEVCLLGSNRCSDKLGEPLLVGELLTPPPQRETAH